ncbi:MAG: T9SS type A sorting domain-containing protein [candidate division KSB1 bacterium]|nr:T9SS type A sorting domain-containing protein [candidate division KSB1 bacterium]
MNLFTTYRPAWLSLLLVCSSLASWEIAQAQSDARFGTVGPEAAERMGLTWYREYQRHNDNLIAPGKQKHFVVGQIPNRNDALGIDWQWYLLDLLEQPNSLLLQHFLNLVLDLVQSEALPVVRDTWRENRPALETLWAQTVNRASKTWKIKVFGVTVTSYTVRLSDTKVSLPEDLPEIQLTVNPDGESITLSVEMDVEWSTHARGSNGSIHAYPTFNTKLTLLGTIVFGEDAQGRYLTVKEVKGKSVTDAQGDIRFIVNILNIGNVSFTWSKLDILIQTQIDNAVAGGIGEIMKIDQNKDGQPDLAQHFYFEPFLSTTFFDGKPIPQQQEIIDRIFQQESAWIQKKITEEQYYGAYWEIGNEPNWFPLMRPAQYAAMYADYYRLIKGIDPTAKCLVGGLFLKEVIENPRDLVLLLVPDLFGLFREELAAFISAALFETSTVSWFEAFTAALPPEVRVEVGNFHLYPIKSAGPEFDLNQVKPHIETLAASFNKKGITEIWLSEFGNIDWRRSEVDVAAMCWQLASYLKSNPVGISRWFWSRSVGYDRRFDAIGKKPVSALLGADNKTLNTIGRIYLIAADSRTTRKDAEAIAERLLQLDQMQTTALPLTLSLAPSYPNPFSLAGGAAASKTQIPYGLPEESEVRLQIYDMMGRLTRQIMHTRQNAGWHQIEWDGRNEVGQPVTSGIYFVVLHAGEQTQTRKLIVTR